MRLSCAAALEQLSHPEFPLPATPTIKSKTFIFLEDRDAITLFLPSQAAPLPQNTSQNGSCLTDANTTPTAQAVQEAVLTSDTCVRLYFSITADIPTSEEPEYLTEDSNPLVEESQFQYDNPEADRPSYHSSFNPKSEEPGPQSEDTRPTVQETQFLDADEGTDRPSYHHSFDSQLSSSCCSDDDSLNTSGMQVTRAASEELAEGSQTRHPNRLKGENVMKSENSETTHRCTSEELKEGLLVAAQDTDMKLETAHGDDDAPHEDDMDTTDDADEDAEQDDHEAVHTTLPPLPAPTEQASTEAEHDRTRTEDVKAQLEDAQDIEETVNTTTTDGEGITREIPDLSAVSTSSASVHDDDDDLPDLHDMITSSARRAPQKSTTPQATGQQARNEDATTNNEHDEIEPADEKSTPSDKPIEPTFASINKKAVKKKSKAKSKVKSQEHAMEPPSDDEDLGIDEVDRQTKPQHADQNETTAKVKALPMKKRQSTGSLKAARDDDETETCDSLFEEPEDPRPPKKRRSAGSAGTIVDPVPNVTPAAKKTAAKQKTPKTPAKKTSKSATATPSTVSIIKKVAFSYSTTVERPAVLKKFFDLGYKKAEHVSPQCDMLVVGTGALQKTIKLLIAVARGTTIVTDEFVTRSAEDGKVPDALRYSPGGIKDAGVCRETLFSGKELYITPALREVYKFEYLNIVELAKIVGFKSAISKVARGVVTNANTIVLGFGDNDPDAMTLNEDGAACYTKDFLSTSILRGEVDFEDDEFQMTFKSRGSQSASKPKVSQSASKKKGSQKDKRRTKSI